MKQLAIELIHEIRRLLENTWGTPRYGALATTSWGKGCDPWDFNASQFTVVEAFYRVTYQNERFESVGDFCRRALDLATIQSGFPTRSCLELELYLNNSKEKLDLFFNEVIKLIEKGIA